MVLYGSYVNELNSKVMQSSRYNRICKKGSVAKGMESKRAKGRAKRQESQPGSIKRAIGRKKKQSGCTRGEIIEERREGTTSM